MPRHATSRILRAAALAAILNLAACSQATPTSATPASGAASGGMPGDPCKVITAADAAGIFTALVVEGRRIGPQSCSWRAGGRSGANLTISLRSGDVAKTQWDFLSNPSNTGSSTPVAGVGDEALLERAGTVLAARKGDLVCLLDLTGTRNIVGMKLLTHDRGAALAHKLGAICNKLFATY